MMDLLEKILQVNEDAKGLSSLYKIYKGQEKGLDPDPVDLFNALYMMEELHKRYLRSFPADETYRRRLQEIQQAFKSRDTGKQIIALDNAVNQFHLRYTDLLHLIEEMEEKGVRVEPELLDLILDIGGVLERLGRL